MGQGLDPAANHLKTTIALILSAAALALSGCVFTPTGCGARTSKTASLRPLSS